MKEMRASLKDLTKTWPNKDKSHPFASIDSKEVRSVEPLIFGVCDILGDSCKENDHSNCFSPAKSEIKRDVALVGTENRSKRLVAGCAGKPGATIP
jgi:hypothetical protein